MPTPTLRSIAQTLGLSIGTVQRALNNKGGYSAETRERILEEARRCGYVVNPAASALSRRSVRLGVILPEPVEEDAYYFRRIWQGIRRGCEELRLFQVDVECIYASANRQRQNEDFLSALKRLSTDEVTQGIVTLESNEESYQQLVRTAEKNGKKISVINRADNRWSNFSPYQCGCVAAEIMQYGVHRPDGQFVLLGGARENNMHHRQAMGFADSIRQAFPESSVLEIYEYHRLDQLSTMLPRLLAGLEDLAGIYAVTSRETLHMCRSVRRSGRVPGSFPVVGSDAFPELLEYFEDHTLMASSYNYPARLAYSILYAMASELTSIQVPALARAIPAMPVFRGNAALFCNSDEIM